MQKHLFSLPLVLILSFVDRGYAGQLGESEPQLLAQMELRNTCETEYETYYDPTTGRMERRSELVCRPRLRFEDIPYECRRYGSAGQDCWPNPSEQRSSDGREFYLRNRCPYSIRLVMRYRELSGEWRTGGWWNFDGHSRAYLASNDQRIRSDNSIIYFYAEVTEQPHTDHVWRGDENREFEGRSLPMRRKELSPDSDEDYTLSLTCD